MVNFRLTLPVFQERAEEIMRKEMYRHAFDVVISRAVFKLQQFLSMGTFFLSPGGIMIAMKGPNIKGEELKDAATTSEKTGLACVGWHDVKLPIIGNLRKIMIYKKL
ncbi:MAG: hypothetical protein CO012_09200 [Syntrophobacterales bacterium CG_4_8_14_3_um_filter_49_14]|nr:MAG: hypothetical protein CO012_09200 [Syntrophobacterales bacterium CG_4_8_14_3_um_filter_49_14]